MKAWISVVVSGAMSGMLFFGDGAVEKFAYYVFWTMAILATVALLSGALAKDEVIADMRARVWINTPSTIVTLAAMIGAGYPGLAAYSFVQSFVIFALLFKDRDNAPAGTAP